MVKALAGAPARRRLQGATKGRPQQKHASSQGWHTAGAAAAAAGVSCSRQSPQSPTPLSATAALSPPPPAPCPALPTWVPHFDRHSCTSREQLVVLAPEGQCCQAALGLPPPRRQRCPLLGEYRSVYLGNAAAGHRLHVKLGEELGHAVPKCRLHCGHAVLVAVCGRFGLQQRQLRAHVLQQPGGVQVEGLGDCEPGLVPTSHQLVATAATLGRETGPHSQGLHPPTIPVPSPSQACSAFHFHPYTHSCLPPLLPYSNHSRANRVPSPHASNR